MSRLSRHGFLAKAALILTPICVEFWLMRRLLHASLGRNTFFLGVYSRDVLVPWLLAALFVLWFTDRQKPFPTEWQPRLAVFNLMLFILTSLLLWRWDTVVVAIGPRMGVALFFCCATMTLLLSPFLFVRPGQLWASASHTVRLPVLLGLVFLSLVLYPWLLEVFWMPLAMATGHTVAAVLSAVNLKTDVNVGCAIFLRHREFAARMAPACSGLEAIFFFLYAFSLNTLFDRTARSPSCWVMLFGLGALWLFLLNVVRTTLLFSAGIFLSHFHSRSVAIAFFDTVVHANLGWILYLAGILIFIHWLKRWDHRQACGQVIREQS